MYIRVGRYRFPTATFDEVIALVEREYNAVKAETPGFVDEFLIREGTEGEHTPVSFVAFFEREAVGLGFGRRVSQLPSWGRFREVGPGAPEILLQGEALPASRRAPRRPPDHNG